MSSAQIKTHPDIDISDFDADFPPILKQVLLRRGIHSLQDLDYSLSNLLPFSQLLNIELAVDLLVQALAQQWRVLIVADFDADGATSCAVAIKALKAMGLTEISYLVPDRFKHGYGLTPIISELASQRQPDLLITVDNGISSMEGVQRANELGMKVLITDHHFPAKTLPDASVIINPNLHGDNFKSKNLAGVGVIFYVMMALRARLRQQNWFNAQRPEPNLGQLLDLVALGTVADVVPLDYNNRILVYQGIQRIRANHCCRGLQALIQVAKRQQASLTTNDLAFSVAPRLNAAGRMETMNYGIECLINTTDNALSQAQTLDEFNQQRRAVEGNMQQQALDLLKNIELDEENLPFGLCLYQPDWHSGVIGIVASRIKEKYHRPVIIFTQDSDTENNGLVRGSARSVTGVHIRDVLEHINSQHPKMIKRFGGHAMAAGLTLAQKDLTSFKQYFDEKIRQQLNIADLQGQILSDGELEACDFTLQFANQLRNLTPWGQHFFEPLFSNHFHIVQRKWLQDKHLKMTVKLPNNSQHIEAILFNVDADARLPETINQVHLAYRLDINDFRGKQTLQLMVKHLQWD